MDRPGGRRTGPSSGFPCVDPEASFLFTCDQGRHDQRLFDEMLDWLALNGGFSQHQRLRNLNPFRINRSAARWFPAVADWMARRETPCGGGLFVGKPKQTGGTRLSSSCRWTPPPCDRRQGTRVPCRTTGAKRRGAPRALRDFPSGRAVLPLSPAQGTVSAWGPAPTRWRIWCFPAAATRGRMPANCATRRKAVHDVLADWPVRALSIPREQAASDLRVSAAALPFLRAPPPPAAGWVNWPVFHSMVATAWEKVEELRGRTPTRKMESAEPHSLALGPVMRRLVGLSGMPPHQPCGVTGRHRAGDRIAASTFGHMPPSMPWPPPWGLPAPQSQKKKHSTSHGFP
jgi:hypothetical protein